jgi:hypothetical protein
VHAERRVARGLHIPKREQPAASATTIKKKKNHVHINVCSYIFSTPEHIPLYSPDAYVYFSRHGTLEFNAACGKICSLQNEFNVYSSPH